MKKILILFAHPRYEQSRSNRVLLSHVPRRSHITVRDLYEAYPDFDVDIDHEKELLAQHDIIILHHPFYWYHAPPLIKQWIDMVLEFGWAYGPGGNALKDKLALNVITSGGARDVYAHDARNRFTVREFLAPFEQTFRLCQVHYLPPFAVQGTHRLADAELEALGAQYCELLLKLSEPGFSHDAVNDYEFLNDWILNSPEKT